MARINYLDRALKTFNAGFPVKARQQEALADVTRAFEEARRILQDACLAARDAEFKMSDAHSKVYWDVPSYPHQFKAKHAEMIRAAFGTEQDEVIAQMEYLAQLRETIKAAPITPAPKDDSLKVLETKVQKTLKELIELRRAQYGEGIQLVEIFGHLPVSVRPHYAVHPSGTGFIRCFYYMNGKLTPLNVILAVLQDTAKED